MNVRHKYSRLHHLGVKVYIGNDDMEVEGVWENWYTDEVNQSLLSGNIVIYYFLIF